MTLEVQAENRPRESPSILFAGDFVLTDIWDDPPIDDSLTESIQSSNIACVNLEAPIAVGDPIQKNGPILSTIEGTSEVLSDAGFDVVCMANNHMMDYGYSGVQRTIDACQNRGLETVGTGKQREDALAPFVTQCNKKEIAIFNVCQHEFGIANRSRPGTAWIAAPGLTRTLIDASSEFDLVFVVVHGGNENVPIPSIRWQERLRELVNAGANAVIAHHPHVPQGWEMYNGGIIFYSLGNFLFDQTRYDANKWSYMVEFTIKEDGIGGANLLFTERNGQQIQIMGQLREKQTHYNYLMDISDIIESSPKNPGYWQAIAASKYNEKYERFFRRLGGGDPVSIYKSPYNEFKRIIELIVNVEEPDLSQQDLLKFLNYMRAECHRDAIISGLEVESEVVTDHRSTETQSEVSELIKSMKKGP